MGRLVPQAFDPAMVMDSMMNAIMAEVQQHLPGAVLDRKFSEKRGTRYYQVVNVQRRRFLWMTLREEYFPIVIIETNAKYRGRRCIVVDEYQEMLDTSIARVFQHFDRRFRTDYDHHL